MKVKNIKDNNRDIGIDIIKTLAISFVVGVHFFLNTKYYTTNLNNANLFFQTYIQQIFLSCIPLFLMATGYLNNNTKITSDYFKKIIPIMILYIAYSIPALIYRYNINEISFDIKLWIEQLLTFKGHRYSWYINMYFGLFLLIPFLNRLYLSLNNKKEKLTLIILLLSLTTLKYVPNYWAKLYPIGYFYIGKFIREFKPKLENKKAILYFLIIITVETTIEFLIASNGRYTHYYNDYSSIFRAIQSLLIFLICYDKTINNNFIKRLVINISKSTLDIYLASFLTDRLLYKPFKALNLPQEQMFMFLPIMVLASLSFAYLIARFRMKYLKVEKLNFNKRNNFKEIKKQAA